ncbi:MAG: hypothetical protein LUD81_03525 [Clostridiales bacterium]|nr:hypothetical protein [Clostridiales bacterium]
MIYISAAIYPEAKPFIEGLGLKADRSFSKIRVYKNEAVTLLLTGTGILRAASSLSFLLGRLTPEKGDIFLNTGVCGGGERGIFICSKITCPELKTCFYPDMIYNSGFREGELVTFSELQRDIHEGLLADTEGAALAQGAKAYFSAERMFFIKIVSDNGDFSGIKPDDVTRLVSGYYGDIIGFLEKIPPEEKTPDLTAEELKEAEKLKFSVSQSVMLKNYLVYYRLNGGDPLSLLKSLPEVKTKAEGRDVLERIGKYVI